MEKITAEDILGYVDDTLKLHGTYYWWDKSGWNDLVSAYKIDERLRQHTPEDIISILKTVKAANEASEKIPSAVLLAYDEDDVMWEALCAVDEKFVSENY